MLQKLEILDTAFDKLEEINNESFSFEKFKNVNSEIQVILNEIKLSKFYLQKNYSSEHHDKIFKNLLYKIDRIERKISPKANLFEEFSKSKL